MSYLLIDIGNSYTKYATLNENQRSSIHYVKSADFLNVLDLDSLKISASPASILLVSVANETLTRNIKSKLSQVFQCTVQQIKTSATAMGVSCGYSDYALLGADRWVAMLAGFNRIKAQSQAKPVLIVDCGTVVTVDVVDGNGQHLGGWMMPGLLLMNDALGEKASGIYAGLKESALYSDFANTNKQQEPLLIGQSTQQCVTVGGRLAEIGFIQQCFSVSEKLLGCAPLCILTGGGAKEIVPLLPMQVEYLPELVLDGLALFIE